MADKDATRIVPVLIQAVGDQDARVRYSAVGALHVVSPDSPMAGEAAAALITAVRDSDPRVRAMAAGILSTFKPPPQGSIPALIAAAKLESDTDGVHRDCLRSFGWFQRRPGFH